MNKSIFKNSESGLRIGIEVTSLSLNQLTGIPRVVIEYINILQNIDKENQYFLYSNRKIKHIDVVNEKWNRKVLTNLEKYKNPFFNFFIRLFTKNYFYVIFILPFLLHRDKIDVFIGTTPQFFPLRLKNRNYKSIIFSYDIVWELFPETMHKTNLFIMKLLAHRNIKSADSVVSISKATRSDLIKILGVDEKKIIPINLAASEKVFFNCKKSSVDIVLKKYNIRKKYILSVCTLEPRKNLKAALKAFSLLENKKELYFVLTGMMGWLNKDFYELFKKYGIADNIIVTGFVPDEDLAPLYSGAELFVYPSIYEGFGLPVLEAMQCGCPVITSNASSLPEVAGDAAILFDPFDVEDIKNKIKMVLNNSKLKNKMKKDGIQRAENFSWEMSARKLLSHIREIRNK